jgi:bifunctional DNA-binding transcriptional regulator/antitoxin component of YhaV-PrlF toxin-antitoxin module
MKNVISFCLFGNNPKYLIGAEENAKLAKQIFPDWECRFYIDIETVPTETINKLKKYSNTNIISKKRNYEYDGLFWRFEPIREFDVDVWISRDVDGNGRILIPENLKNRSGLTNKVIVIGVQNRAEIWNEKAWNDYKKVVEKQADALADKLGQIGVL